MGRRSSVIIRNIWHYWLVALSFLTCIPTPRYLYQTGDLSQAAIFFPVVGGLIGAFNYGLYYLLRIFKVGNWFMALVLVLFPLILTRGLHLDGWADVCDALFSTADVNKRREILKDSRLGTHGVTGIFFLLSFKTAALVENFLPIFLIVAPMAGRTAALVIGGLFHPFYQGKKSLGEEFIGRIPRWSMGVWLIIMILFPFFGKGNYYPIKAAFIFFVGWLFGKLTEKSFQGLNGDTAGAAIELIETLFLYLGRI